VARPASLPGVAGHCAARHQSLGSISNILQKGIDEMSNLSYGSYCGIQNASNSLYLSWDGSVLKPKGYTAIVYNTLKDLWFDNSNGGSGDILTGDQLYVRIDIVVHLWLTAVPAVAAEWANVGTTNQETIFQLYTDQAMTPGLSIPMGSQVYIYNPGNSAFLTLSSTTPQVTIGAVSSSAQWNVVST
jgi:hypothetical protein